MLVGVSFLSPWLLLALLSVPVLWWLLRALPPRPKTMVLPSFFLLEGLETNLKTASTTPWWLLVLRALAVIFLILALADPVFKSGKDLPGAQGGGQVLIVVDNGWATASAWPQRLEKIREYLPQLRRQKRNVVFLPTAPSAQDGQVRASNVMTAEEAEGYLFSFQPQAWNNDRLAANKIADKAIEQQKITHTLFFTDGLADGEVMDFVGTLRRGGGVTVFNDTEVNNPYILRQKPQKPGDLAFTLERLSPVDTPVPLVMTAYAEGGNILDRHEFVFPAGSVKMNVQWDIVQELRGDIARVALNVPQMASTVFITDSQWQQKPVGIVTAGADPENEGFLNEAYYLKRALDTGGSVATGTPEQLVTEPLSAIIWPDSANLTAAERIRLQQWVEEEGGLLIRFAGPNMAENAEDGLLPVPLRHGQRAMQGAMTWEKPVTLGAIPQESPLYGLTIPKDVTVKRQLLADPSPEVFEKTWLQLNDGTPLLTGGAQGKGAVALIHTTAGPDWSDFCYSGLYVETLQRLISLGKGVSGYKAQMVLPPISVLDGFGRLSPAGGIVTAIDPKRDFIAAPMTPPGIYGTSSAFEVFNLPETLGPMQRLQGMPSGVDIQSYDLSGTKSLKAAFFKLLLLLLAIDTLATLWLRGVIGASWGRVATIVAIGMVLLSSPAAAQDIDYPDLASGIYLAYIETGDQQTDSVSYNGLEALGNVVSRRTNIKIEGVKSVDPAVDNLSFYPVIYWPMSESQLALSRTAAQNLRNYLAQGGMIFIDTRDRQFAADDKDASGSTPGLRQLRKLTADIPMPVLMPVAEDHILTKSFYLLNDFPGLYAGGKLWVEKEPSARFDSVTGIVIGGNDWAVAWSLDADDRARYRVTPGGEAQREMAYRFGVNLLMVALAGSYKADQVHVPYILERIGK